MAGGKGSGTFKMSGTVGSRGSAKSSPAKPSTPKRNNVKGAAANKRKRASENEYVRDLLLFRVLSADDGQSSDEANESEPTVKAEPHGSDTGGESPTSAKKPKTEAAGSQEYASANGIKEELSQQMDGVFDAHFSIPGEI